MEPLDVKVARLEAQVAGLRADVTDIKTDQKAQLGKLDQLLAVENQRKGAKAVTKTLWGIGSGSGFVALLGWLWEHLSRGP